MSRRRFNKTERAVLYLAANGRCCECHADLRHGWHSDHVYPFSKDGITDLINGQALCPECNLRKGNRIGMELREWQQQAIDKYYQHGSPNFLVSATPGAGKTTCALTLAKQLIESGVVQRIAVIVPTDTLRSQWADAAAAAGISLMPVGDPSDYDKDGYLGYVATYQQLARGAGAGMARHATRLATAVILDEIHHAGEKKSWGDGLFEAFEHAVTRIGLTGTPWRENKHEPIPFVTYDDDGVVQVDFPYEYGSAVADGVCRPIEFHAYDGEARWRDCGLTKSADLSVDMDDNDVPAALDAVLRPDHAWMPALLAKAVAALDELRQDVPDAGGLVVAHDVWLANQYADILEQITGERPTVATSEDPNAKGHIDAYRGARSTWLVAVKMVSEGVDIPRLGIVVYAAKTRTPLFFRQVVGRIVRKRDGDPEFNARMFIPAIPALMSHAAEIEDELRHQLEVETERDKHEIRDEDRQRTLPLVEPIGASEAVFGGAIYRGGNISPEQHALAEQKCRQHNIPTNFAVNIAALLSEQQPTIVQPAAKRDIPQWRRESLLRSQIDRQVGKYAYRSGMEKKDVNLLIMREFGERRKCSVETLEQILATIAAWTDALR